MLPREKKNGTPELRLELRLVIYLALIDLHYNQVLVAWEEGMMAVNPRRFSANISSPANMEHGDARF